MTGAGTTTHAQSVRDLCTMLLDAGWKPSEIDAAEIWQVAHLCNQDDGVLHGADLAAANVLAAEGKMERPVPVDPRTHGRLGDEIAAKLAESRAARAESVDA